VKILSSYSKVTSLLVELLTIIKKWLEQLTADFNANTGKKRNACTISWFILDNQLMHHLWEISAELDLMGSEIKELLTIVNTANPPTVMIPLPEAVQATFKFMESPSAKRNLVYLSRGFLIGSGLCDEPRTLYLRPACRDQISFVMEEATVSVRKQTHFL
jgi:hypothetical protein